MCNMLDMDVWIYMCVRVYVNTWTMGDGWVEMFVFRCLCLDVGMKNEMCLMMVFGDRHRNVCV